jgi:hypothetical protein
VFPGTPTTLTVSGGKPPYSAFSSNPTILPVAQAVAGATVVLLAANVGADTSVTVTVQDSAATSTAAAVTVHPALLLPASITITGNPICAGSNAQLCSGQDGTATVKVTGPTGAGLPGRLVRFDVIQGDFALVSTNPPPLLVPTLTVVTDQNGLAAVTMRVPTTAVTQFATIRATDVASGNSVIGQFTIAQFINGNAVLSVIPPSPVSAPTTFTGPDTDHCSSGGQATFYIFGGTPPYTVVTNFPTAITILGAPVPASGGGFTIVTNGTCFTGLTFAITDAAGRTLLTPPIVDNLKGTAAPPPAALVITPNPPPAQKCVSGTTFNLLATGGTGTYNVAINPSNAGNPVATGGSSIKVSFSAAPTPATQDFTLTVSSGSQIVPVTISCTA